MDGLTTSFETLLGRVRQGDPEAVAKLYELYSDPVRRVVRRMLRTKLRRRYDSVDFVQSVWASFVDLSHAKYTFETPEDLVAFLSRIAYNKVAETTRQRLGTQKYDMNRETSLDAPTSGCDPLGAVLPGRTFTPSQYVIADERWEKIIRGVPEGHRRVLELLRQGYSHVEISRTLDVHPKVIQRLLNRLRHYLETE